MKSNFKFLTMLTAIFSMLVSCQSTNTSETESSQNSVDIKSVVISEAQVIDNFQGALTGDPMLTDAIAQQYYSGITAESGNLLKSQLDALISPKQCKTSYSALWNYFPYCDADPENPNSNKIVSFYSGTPSDKSSMNREHVWPNSRGGGYIEGDPHMTRPTLTKENSARGNSFYVEGLKKPSGGWDPAMESFGLEKYRGISARIIFYCAVQDTRLKLVDTNDDSTSNNSMGKLSDLLKWNLMYPIDESEILRNEVLSGARTINGKTFNFNRNPFIDNRSYACKIWGNTNSTTQSICAGNY